MDGLVIIHHDGWVIIKGCVTPITMEKILLPRDTDHKTEWQTVLTLIRQLLRSNLIRVYTVCSDLSVPSEIAADNTLIFYFYLSKKIKLEVSCESLPSRAPAA